MWLWLRTLLAGGKSRWLRVTAVRLTAAADADRWVDPRDTALLADALEVGVGTHPDAMLALFRTCRKAVPPDRLAAALPPARLPRLRPRSNNTSVAAWQLCVAAADCVGAAEVRGDAALRLARLLTATGSANQFIAHLEQCRGFGVLPPEVLGEVIEARVRSHGWEDEPAWRPFFAQFPESVWPRVFELHLALGRLADAVALADTPARRREAVRRCIEAGTAADAERAVELAARHGDSEDERLARKAAAAAHERDGNWVAALSHYERLADRGGQSRCHEGLGDPDRALDLCPAEDDDRRGRLFDQCVRRATDAATAGEFATSLTRLTTQVNLAGAAGEHGDWPRRHGTVRRQREAVRDAVRARYEADGAGSDPTSRREVWLRWAACEEAAEEWVKAATLLEEAGERLRASGLWERDGHFGEAIRVLGPLAGQADVRAHVAALYERAGGHRQAAEVYAALERWADAARAYESGGFPLRAAECVARTARGPAVDDPEYVRLMAAADRAEDVLRACVGRAEAAPDDSAAAGRLKEVLARHRDRVRSPELLTRADRLVTAAVSHDLRRRFDERVGGWVATARAAAVRRYAPIWGMDLGTSKSAVCVYDLTQRLAVVCPHHGRPHFPSVLAVGADGREVIPADEGQLLDPGRFVGAIAKSKRSMGTRTRWRIRDRQYAPEEVATRLIAHGRTLAERFVRERILAAVGEAARRELGEEVPGGWLDEPAVRDRAGVSLPKAVITIPAYFDYAQRRATRDAAELAGVEVGRLVSEPSAACYSVRTRGGLSGRVLVVDLGAGTLDLSYLTATAEADGRMFDVTKIFGDTAFGSSDFDRTLLDHFAAKLRADGVAVPAAGLDLKRLEAAVEQLKIQLSDSPVVEYTLNGFAGRDRVTLELTAGEYVRLIGPHLDRLEAVCQPAGGLAIDHLVLVGAPMRSAPIRGRLEQVFGRRPLLPDDPRTAVAEGAGRYAGFLSDPTCGEPLLYDVVPFALGVVADRGSKDDRKPFVSYHIARGAKIPCSKTLPYTTAEDNQTTVPVQVRYGAGEAEAVDQSRPLETFELTGIPPAKTGEPKIEVTFDIDVNGVLDVKAVDTKTNRSAQTRIRDITWLSPTEKAGMAARWRVDAEVERTAGWFAAIRERLDGLRAEFEAARLGDHAARWQARFEPLAAKPPAFWNGLPANLSAVAAEMFRDGPRVADEYLLGRERAGNALAACERAAGHRGERWAHLRRETDERVERFAGANLGEEELNRRVAEVVAEFERAARTLVEEADRTLSDAADTSAAFRSAADTLDRWAAVLAEITLAAGTPAERLRAAHAVGDLDRAAALFDEAYPAHAPDPAPPADVRLTLDALARLGDRPRYRTLLNTYAARLAVRPIDFARPDEFARAVRSAVAVVRTEGGGGGSGFLVSPRHVVTTCHLLASDWPGGSLPAESAVRVWVGGSWRTVRRIHTLPRLPDPVDLAVLELAEPTDAAAVRVGYSRLLEIPERVLAVGHRLPDSDRPDDEPAVDLGSVRKFTARGPVPLIELGFELRPGMSGGPVFNDLGEVVGVATTVHRPATPEGDAAARHYALGVEPLGRLIDLFRLG